MDFFRDFSERVGVKGLRRGLLLTIYFGGMEFFFFLISIHALHYNVVVIYSHKNSNLALGSINTFCKF